MDRIYDLYIFQLVNRINFEKAMRQHAMGEWLATRQCARGLDDRDKFLEGYATTRTARNGGMVLKCLSWLRDNAQRVCMNRINFEKAT